MFSFQFHTLLPCPFFKSDDSLLFKDASAEKSTIPESAFDCLLRFSVKLKRKNMPLENCCCLNITKCIDLNYSGHIQLKSEKILFKMRDRPVFPATEVKAHKCVACEASYSVLKAIDAALESGFQRCFNR